MAIITHKNNRRCRVQFSMSPELYETYKKILTRVSKLQAVIDFGSDFEDWFRNELDQVSQMLEKEEVSHGNNF